jgi:SAM-dependent methyltransferase
VWTKAEAEYYDETSAEMFEPAALDPMVDFLFEQARGGPMLEFAIGTGRVALPVAARGLSVQGIELSPSMAEQLARKPGGDEIDVTIGDMASTRVPGEFTLVYVVWNALMNVPSQDDQVAVFENAAAHLAPGGRFVIEILVPTVGHRHVFSAEPGHAGIDTLDDLAGQLSSSHHWMNVDGRFVYHAGQYRYVWPSELLLMGRVAGLRFVERWGSWTRAPFSAAAASNSITVFEKSWKRRSI